ncbi:nucleotidyltransferase family protein [Halomonas sp.]|uniref:nucleotidyltransferase family protein n=1 Tax=Halomonas sp. TaxID=1486246 RepID=UPI003D0C6471
MRSKNSLALIMAAGHSRRFGSDKRVATLNDGRTLLAATFQAACAAFKQVRVVVNSQVSPTELGIPESLAIVINTSASAGLGGSISNAIQALDKHMASTEFGSIAIWLGDMPWVRPETCWDLAQRVTANTIVRPTYRGDLGHPVFFGSNIWPALGDAKDERGGRHVLTRFAHQVINIPVTDPGVVQDIDYPDAIPKSTSLP